MHHPIRCGPSAKPEKRISAHEAVKRLSPLVENSITNKPTDKQATTEPELPSSSVCYTESKPSDK